MKSIVRRIADKPNIKSIRAHSFNSKTHSRWIKSYLFTVLVAPVRMTVVIYLRKDVHKDWLLHFIC